MMVAITVAVAAGMFSVVYGAVATDEPPLRASFTGSIHANEGGWGTADETVTVTHKGGEAIDASSLAVVVEVGGAETRFTQGGTDPLDHGRQDAFSASDTRLMIGERWRSTNLTISAQTRVAVTVIDTNVDVVVWTTAFQSGVGDCGTDTGAPIVARWTQTPSDLTTDSTGAVTVEATASDNCSDVDTTKDPHLHYRVNDGTDPAFSDAGAMTLQSGTTWAGDIPDQAWGAEGGNTLEYQVVGMADVNGNTGDSGIRQDRIDRCPDDSAPPTVSSWSQSPTDVTTASTGDVTVTATLQDDCAGVDTTNDPNLQYRINTGSDPAWNDTGDMTLHSGTQWEGTIPDLAWSSHGGKTLEYRLVDMADAKANTGSSTTQQDPIQAATVSYVQTPFSMVTGTAVDDDQARSADDGGAAATLTEAAAGSGTDTLTLSADSIVGTSAFTPASNVFNADQTFASHQHSAALFSGSEDNTFRKIDQSGTEVWTVTDSKKVLDVAVGQDGHAYFASEDNKVVKVASDGSVVWTFTGHTNKALGVAVDRNGFVYSASEDGTVRKIDSSGTQVWSFTGHSNKVHDVAVGPDGFVHSASEDNTVRKLDSSGTQVWSFTGHTNKVLGVDVDPDGFVYSASEDDTVRKIDSSGTQVWSFTGNTHNVHDVAVDEDGFVYSASEDNTVRKIDSSGTQVWSFTGHTSKVFGVDVDPDGFVYSASEDGTVRKLDSSGMQVWSFTGHTNKVFGVAVDNDARSIRTGLADHTSSKEITKVVLKADVRASSTDNRFRLQGCLSGGSCTNPSAETQVGTSTETISYDITERRPGGGSWTWSDINNLEGVVDARSTRTDAVTLEIDHVYVEVAFGIDYDLETDALTFDPLGAGTTNTLEIRYQAGGSESFQVEIWDGTSWTPHSPALDQSSSPLFDEELTLAEVSSGPQIRILDQDTAPNTQGTLDLDYVRVVTS